MSAVCIIPARGGSKRIPRKNIRLFNGRPIIAYAIQTALESACFDEVMVSTDDPQISQIALDCGAKVPFARSHQNSGDFAGSEMVFQEVIERYAQENRNFELACGIYPTAALLTENNVRKGLQILKADNRLTTVLSVQQFRFPIQRALHIREGRTHFYSPEHVDTRSQDLEPSYHDAGQFYWFRVRPFLRTRELIGPNCAGLLLTALEAQDIDCEDDWVQAELKQKGRQADFRSFPNRIPA